MFLFDSAFTNSRRDSQQIPQFFDNSRHGSPVFSGTSPFNRPLFISPNNGSALQPSPSCTAGRKRSRDESVATEDETGTLFVPRQTLRSNKHTTLPGPGPVTMGAGSSKGPVNIPLEGLPVPHPTQAIADQRLKPVSRKSQRLCRGENFTDQDTRYSSSGTTADTDEPMLTSRVQEAVIDEASRILGIGWTQVKGEQAREAAARGWARYITNHFGLAEVEILLQNKGNGSYLVKASIDGTERYCRFSEDLNAYQLVAAATEGWSR